MLLTTDGKPDNPTVVNCLKSRFLVVGSFLLVKWDCLEIFLSLDIIDANLLVVGSGEPFREEGGTVPCSHHEFLRQFRTTRCY